jgi:hypothetical protein
MRKANSHQITGYRIMMRLTRAKAVRCGFQYCHAWASLCSIHNFPREATKDEVTNGQG